MPRLTKWQREFRRKNQPKIDWDYVEALERKRRGPLTPRQEWAEEVNDWMDHEVITEQELEHERTN